MMTTDYKSMSKQSSAAECAGLMPRLLRIEEVADILQISRSMAYALCTRGELPCIRIGRSVRVSYAQLERFCEANTTESQQIGDFKC